jgi:hypothetical protein
VAGSSLAGSRVIFIAFADSEKYPSVIVKVLRQNGRSSSVAKEHKTLNHINSKLGYPPSIPRSLWNGWIGNDYVSVETAIVGKLMGNIRSPWLSNDVRSPSPLAKLHLHRSLEWLSDFHSKTTADHITMSSDTLQEYLYNSVIPQTVGSAIPSDFKDAVLGLTRQLAGWLQHQTLPLVCEHGDYWAGNLYITKDQKVGVVDWTDAEFGRLPIFDAPFFVASYTLGFAPLRGNRYWMFEQLLDQRTWFTDEAFNTLAAYFKRMGISLDDAGLLIALAVGRKAFLELQNPCRDKVYTHMFSIWMNRQTI